MFGPLRLGFMEEDQPRDGQCPPFYSIISKEQMVYRMKHQIGERGYFTRSAKDCAFGIDHYLGEDQAPFRN